MLSKDIPDGFFDTGLIGLDTETTCSGGDGRKLVSDPHSDRLLLVSLCNGNKSIVLKPNQSWLPKLWDVMANPDVKTVAHNYSFDLKFLFPF